jgi:DNA-binding PadR family transcriptional regulator
MSEELQKRKEFLKNAPLEDYLDEDPKISNQQFFILSYILPDKTNELHHPVIKIRGSYSTQEDCEKRIEKLKRLDTYHNMYVCEVGKFGSLLPVEEIEKNDEVDIKYREGILNTMVKEYKENKDKKDQEFEDRKEFMAKRAKYEGTIKGQEELAKVRENPVAVRSRIENMSKHLEELTTRIKEVTEIVDLSKKQMDTYTPEEIKEAESKHSEDYPSQ